MKVRIFITIIITIILLLVCTVMKKNISLTNEISYTFSVIEEYNGAYIVYIYDQRNNIIHEQTFPKEPFVEKLNDNIVMIGISLGNHLNYIYFYNVETNKISPAYENIIKVLENKIAYMYEGDLIITDIFDEKLYYKKISREWSQTAIPSNSIINIELLENNQIRIIYYFGDTFEIVEELIDL